MTNKIIEIILIIGFVIMSIMFLTLDNHVTYLTKKYAEVKIKHNGLVAAIASHYNKELIENYYAKTE